MDAAAEIGRNPVSKHRIQLEYGEFAGLRGTGRPNPSRETNFSGANEDRGKNIFPCSADHEQDWQPYPVDPYSAINNDHTCIYFYFYLFTFCRFSRLIRTYSAKSDTMHV